MCELDLRAAVWVSSGLPNKEARDLCLASIVSECARSDSSELIIERDESLMGADRRVISAALRLELKRTLKYKHALPHEQPLLWVSDALAWCYAKGGDWRRRVDPIIENRVIKL